MELEPELRPVTPAGAMHAATVTAFFLSGLREGREGVIARQSCGCRAEPLRVQRAGAGPAPAVIKRRTGLRRDADAVHVLSRDGVEPGVEPRLRGARRRNPNARREQRIHRAAQCLRLPPRRRVHRGDLPDGVNPAVGAPAANDPHRPREEPGEHGLKFALDRGLVFLQLPAEESAAVVLNPEPDAMHL